MATHKHGIYRRGNIWWKQYFDHGRKIAESCGTSDEVEARRQLQVKLGEVAAGNHITPRRTTIADLCARVMDIIVCVSCAEPRSWNTF